MYRESAYNLHQLFLKGQVSACEITSYFLKRIELLDPKVGAFLTTFPDRALERAKKLDEKKAAGKKVGKLAAIPIGVKDNIHMKGEMTTCASRFLTNYRAPFDATAVRLLEEEDAIILGKTNLDEFAMGSSNEHSALQETNNPWNLELVPGGSSGGSAAALAARLCPITLGSDTGGSVRQPAAFCGVVGFKPSYGRVSRYGLVAFGSSLDQIGPMATRSKDIGMVMEVMGQHDPHDATSLHEKAEDYLSFLEAGGLEGKKIGVPWSFLEKLDPEVRKNFEEGIKTLKQLGCEVIDVDLSILKYSVATYYIISAAEVSTNLVRFDGIRFGVRAKEAKTLEEVYTLSRTQGFGLEVKRRILLGTYVLSSGFQDAYYKQAMRMRSKIMECFDQLFEEVDAIATPMSPMAAFKKDSIHDPLEMYLLDIYTIGANLARLPAISVPSGFDKEKRPLGLQFMGKRRKDPFICGLAHFYEKASTFAREIPEEFDKEVS